MVNKVLLEQDGQKVWIFHGDVFDVTMQYSKWLAKFGSAGYDLLILLNSLVNFLLISLGREKISFSRKIKHKVKSAVSYINRFEETAAGIAISNGYTHVCCGHIHHPEIRTIRDSRGEVIYMNSGDWVENLSALEYYRGEWRIYRFREDLYAQTYALANADSEPPARQDTFRELLKEFHLD